MKFESRAAVGAMVVSLAGATMGLGGCERSDGTTSSTSSTVAVRTMGSGTFEIEARGADEVASGLARILRQNKGMVITDIVSAGYDDSTWHGNGFVVLVGPGTGERRQEVEVFNGIDAEGLAAKLARIRSEPGVSVDHIVRAGYTDSHWSGNGFVIVVGKAVATE